MVDTVEYGTTTKYRRLEQIGSGVQAIVYLVERIEDKKKFIAKINRD